MADIITIDDAKAEKARHANEQIIASLEHLVDQAKAGEIIGYCFVGIPPDRHTIKIGAVANETCGSHELVGASAMLADFISGLASASHQR